MSAPQLETGASEWRATPPDEVVWASWDDDHIAYHRPSGKTHLLNAAAARLLTVILVDYRTTRSAASELAAAQGVAAGEDFVAEVRASIERLEQLGLVQRRAV